MDKEELVHVIMRYRGTREQMLILKENGDGAVSLERLLRSGRIRTVQGKDMHIPSRIIVYEGRTMDENDRIYVPYCESLEDTNAVLVSEAKEGAVTSGKSPDGGPKAGMLIEYDKTSFERKAGFGASTPNYYILNHPKAYIDENGLVRIRKNEGMETSAMINYQVEMIWKLKESMHMKMVPW